MYRRVEERDFVTEIGSSPNFHTVAHFSSVVLSVSLELLSCTHWAYMYTSLIPYFGFARLPLDALLAISFNSQLYWYFLIFLLVSTTRTGILDYISTTMIMLSLGDSSIEEGSARNRS